MPGTVAGDFHLQARAQGVGYRNANAVQAAGKTVGRGAVALVELAAGVELGEYHLNRRDLLDRVNFDRNAAPVIQNRYRAVKVQGDLDTFAVSAQRFVGSVVDGFLHDVQRIVRSGVHAGAMANGLQPLENGNGFSGVAHCRGVSSLRVALACRIGKGQCRLAVVFNVGRSLPSAAKAVAGCGKQKAQPCELG